MLNCKKLRVTRSKVQRALLLSAGISDVTQQMFLIVDYLTDHLY